MVSALSLVSAGCLADSDAIDDDPDALEAEASSEDGKADGGTKCAAGTQTIAAGTIVGRSTTWTRCDIRLEGGATVAAGKTLRIRKGATVTAATGASLDVQGTLRAIGTATAPIMFRARTEGSNIGSPYWIPWRGISLTGRGNELVNVSVLGAEVAVSVSGGQARLVDVTLEGFSIYEANQFALLPHLLGQSTTSRAGLAVDGADVEVDRTLIRGFVRGITSTDAIRLVVSDSVIRENEDGVVISDDTPWDQTCGAGYLPPPPPPPLFDPVFIHSDIAYNRNRGLWITGAQVVQVDGSNIVGNRFEGVSLQSKGLHPDTFITGSNLYGNGYLLGHQNAANRVQVVTWHMAGTLPLTKNYWGDGLAPMQSSGGSLDDGRRTTPFETIHRACGQGGVDAADAVSSRIEAAGPRVVTGPLARWMVTKTPGRALNPLTVPIGASSIGWLNQALLPMPEQGSLGSARVTIDYRSLIGDARLSVYLYDGARQRSVLVFAGVTTGGMLSGSYDVSGLAGGSIGGTWLLYFVVDPTNTPGTWTKQYGVLRSWSLDVAE